MLIDTSETLKLCQKAMKHPDQQVKDAGESVMSWIVVYLRHKSIMVPQPLEQAYKTLDRVR